MSGKKRTTLFVLGVASALGISWLVRQREEIGGLRIWRQVLIRHHGAEKEGQLTKAIRQQCAV